MIKLLPPTIFGLLLLPSPLSAQSIINDMEEDHLELPELTVTAEAWTAEPRLPLGADFAPGSVPLSITTLENATLERHTALDLRSALALTPGAVDSSINGINDMFSVRGFDSLNGGTVLIDGVFDPESTIYPTYNLERIELIRGPASFRYGPNTLAASANLVRKRPDPDENFHDFTFIYGSHQNRELQTDYNLATENLAARINAFGRSAESHRSGIDAEQAGINPTIALPLGEATRLDLSVDYLYSRVTPDAGLPTLGTRLATRQPSRTFGLPSDRSEQEVIRALASIEHQLSDDLLLRNRSYFHRLDWESNGAILAGFVAFGTGLEPFPRTLSRLNGVLDDEQTLLGNETEAIINGSIANLDHTLLLGFEFTRLRDQFTLAVDTATSIDLPNGFETPGFVPGPPTNVGDATADFYGLYAYDQLQLSERSYLLLGARIDRYEFEDDAKNLATDDTLFSPFGGAIVGLTKQLSLFANTGVGYAPPSTESANPSGEAEKSLQLEGGLRYEQPERGYAQLAAFTIERDNIGIPNSLGTLTEEGTQESTGIEIESAILLTPNARLRASYTWLDSELTRFTEQLGPLLIIRDGATAPFAPEHTAQLWGEIQLNDELGIGIGLRYISEQFISATNNFEIDAYTTVDAALFFETEAWGFRLALRNLTDETILNRGLGETSVIPEDGINATAALTFKL